MIIAIVVLVAVMLFLFSLCCDAWGLMLAGKVVRIGKITFKCGLIVALLSFIPSLILASIYILVPIENVPFSLLISLANVLVLTFVVKQVLSLRFWKALGVMILGGVFAVVFQVPMVLGAAVLIRTHVMAVYKIHSGTMLPTLDHGDRILVNKLAYQQTSPQRWDVAAFRMPSDPKRVFAKRVVGLSGESIEISDNGRILINGEVLVPPPTLTNIQWVSLGEYGKSNQPFRIPEDCYFILSENSVASLDSRHWGCVPRGLFIGKAMYIIWPPEHVRGVDK